MYQSLGFDDHSHFFTEPCHLKISDSMESLPDQPSHVNSNIAYDSEKLEWIPLSLTLVEYPQGDFIGKSFALLSLTPFVIVAGFITLIIFRRDLHTITFFTGVTINECINFILKHTICEPRPMKRAGIYIEYGMPSTHAQFMWFFAMYTILFIWIRLHHNSNTTISEIFWRWFITIGCIASATVVTYSRIYLVYHTGFQVFCGMLLGIVIGVIWFLITQLILTPLYPIIVSWRISEYLLLRDTTLIPNVLWFEYTNIRTETRARSRKFVSMKSQ